MNTKTNSRKWSWIQANERRAAATGMLLLLLMLPTVGAQAGAVLTPLYSFGALTNGAYPNGLVQGSDGNFYGTTSSGGTNGNYGTVFKITPNGVLTSLYSFNALNDGGVPNGLVQGSDGNFYGTTGYGGGTNYAGTVFKISPKGALTSLYSFTGGNDGGNPAAALVQGSDGNFYGTTQSGGTNVYGTVFKITPNGALTTLYAFGTVTNANGQPLDGLNPMAALVQGSDGNLYGTTEYGGLFGGVGPLSGWGRGTVFKISTNGAFTSLYSFNALNDGGVPNGLVQGSDGYFYGTTSQGGTNAPPYGLGTVFKISTNGVLTTLFTGGNDGAYPEAALVQGSDGYIYGTTGGGGTNDTGTVFRISTNGAFTSLYSFNALNDGGVPNGLVQGSDGYFYGTTSDLGIGGNGTVFKISPDGALTTLYSFTSRNDGANPWAGLVQGSDGNFYGTTEYGGGANYAGTVFKISPKGAYTSLYSFTGRNDGANPWAGLVQGSDGNFYGMTEYGGMYGWEEVGGYGTVFKISTNGAFTSLYSFGSVQDTNGYPLDGASPCAALVQGSDGYFYGTTAGYLGTVFKISTNGALTTLYSFTYANSGWDPNGLVQGSDGNFYGTTRDGGTYGHGTVFRISTNGALTTLYSFLDNGVSIAGNGFGATLMQASDGNFYGTTMGGGEGRAGTIFRLTIVPEPQLTIIPSGPYVVLTWPTNASGFTLQSSTNLGSSAVWTTNSSPPVVIGGDNVVINAISGRQQFYRLSQ